MRVALTRERGGNDRLRALIGRRAEVVEIPLTVTHYRPLPDVAADVRAIDDFGHVHTLVVTSARCARYLPLTRAALVADPVVLSVGSATSATLRRSGWVVTGESPETALDLADVVVAGPVAILGAVGGRDELARTLRDRAYDVHVVECYTTIARILDGAECDALAHADVVFIGAPSAWRVASAVVAPDAWVLVPGRTTREVVRADHDRVLLGWGDDFTDAWRAVQSSIG